MREQFSAYVLRAGTDPQEGGVGRTVAEDRKEPSSPRAFTKLADKGGSEAR